MKCRGPCASVPATEEEERRIGRRRNPHKAASAARARWDLLLKSAKQRVSVADYTTAKGNPVTLKNAMARAKAGSSDLCDARFSVPSIRQKKRSRSPCRL